MYQKETSKRDLRTSRDVCRTQMSEKAHLYVPYRCAKKAHLCLLLKKACPMGWLWLVGSLKLQVSFAKEPYKRDDILQKRPIILRSLLIVATPYENETCEYEKRHTHEDARAYAHTHTHMHTHIHTHTNMHTHTHAHTHTHTHTYTHTHTHTHDPSKGRI